MSMYCAAGPPCAREFSFRLGVGLQRSAAGFMQGRRLLNGSTVMQRVLLSAAMIGAVLFTAAAANAETVLVDMKGPGAGNPFWAAVEEGAKAKGKELGVEVRVMSPPQESDVAAQIAQIEDQIAQGVDGIALAPTDPNALAPVVDAA